MIYVDSSVALVQLLSEPARPPPGLWNEPLVSSRLFEYEIWNRLHAHGMAARLDEQVREMIALVDVIEMTPDILARAKASFAVPVRTLDSLHLAPAIYLHERNSPTFSLATYDRRMADAAESLGLPLLDLTANAP